MENTDAKQIGGNHYKDSGESMQHWNLVVVHKWDYFQAQIIKYVMRWKRKGGIQDLEKAQHFLQKYIEVSSHYAEQSEKGDPTKDYVNQ